MATIEEIGAKFDSFQSETQRRLECLETNEKERGKEIAAIIKNTTETNMGVTNISKGIERIERQFENSISIVHKRIDDAKCSIDGIKLEPAADAKKLKNAIFTNAINVTIGIIIGALISLALK